MIRPHYNRRRNYYNNYNYNQSNYYYNQNYENYYYQDKKNNDPNNVENDPNALGGEAAAMGPIEMHYEPVVKHPLQNQWTLWYLEPDRTKCWEDLQNEIASFETVEDFWSLYNHIKLASEIKVGSDYSLFKRGIRPMWEDEANKKGGRWVITLSKHQRRTELDTLWLDVLLCLIGEAFENSEEVCGAVVNIRPKFDKICIWTGNGNNEAAAKEIGYKLQDALRLQPDKLHYQLHKDTMVKQGSGVKTTYIL